MAFRSGNAVLRLKKAQEDDPTLGYMLSVMEEGAIAILPPMPNNSA